MAPGCPYWQDEPLIDDLHAVAAVVGGHRGHDVQIGMAGNRAVVAGCGLALQLRVRSTCGKGCLFCPVRTEALGDERLRANRDKLRGDVLFDQACTERHGLPDVPGEPRQTACALIPLPPLLPEGAQGRLD